LLADKCAASRRRQLRQLPVDDHEFAQSVPSAFWAAERSFCWWLFAWPRPAWPKAGKENRAKREKSPWRGPPQSLPAPARYRTPGCDGPFRAKPRAVGAERWVVNSPRHHHHVALPLIRTTACTRIRFDQQRSFWLRPAPWFEPEKLVEGPKNHQFMQTNPAHPSPELPPGKARRAVQSAWPSLTARFAASCRSIFPTRPPP